MGGRLNPSSRKRRQARHSAADGEIDYVLIRVQAVVLDHHARDLAGSPADLGDADDLALEILNSPDLFGNRKNIRQNIFCRRKQNDVCSTAHCGKSRNGVPCHELGMTREQALDRQSATFHVDKLCVDAVLLKKTAFSRQPQARRLPGQTGIRDRDLLGTELPVPEADNDNREPEAQPLFHDSGHSSFQTLSGCRSISS